MAVGGDFAHSGSWFGLPDFGITEKLGGLISGGSDTDLSSAITNYGAQTVSPVPAGGSQSYTMDTQGNRYPTVMAAQAAQQQGYNPSRDSQGRVGTNTGYGVDQSFRYSGYGQDFGTGDEARKAYEAYPGQVDAAFNDTFGALQQAEDFYRGEQPKLQAEAQGQYNVNQKLLEGSKGRSLGEIGQQELAGKRSTEDALMRAKRILQEQMIGAQQRYGGQSSAGEGARELLARGYQTDTAQTGRQATDFTAKIGQMKVDLEDKYKEGLLQLEQQKSVAMNQLNRDFQNKLLEIANTRAQTNTQKAQMKLQALQELRNQAFAIQQQNQQFAQTLQAQREQANLQLEMYNKTGQGAAQGAQSAYGSLNSANTGQQYGVSFNGAPGQGQAPLNQYIGQIGKSVVRRNPDGSAVYSDGTSGWSY